MIKQFIFFIILSSFLFSACNNNKKPVGTEDAKEKTANAEEMQEASDRVQKKTEELGELTPLTPDELKVLLPEELIGAKKITAQANSVNGTGLVRSQYILNDSAEFQVSVSDCGGPGGAGYYNRQAISMLNKQSKADEENTKTVDLKDEKALQHCNSAETNCSFTYFDGNRFWVIISGKNIPPDDLKQAAKDLKLK
jgi:hypothetical protein